MPLFENDKSFMLFKSENFTKNLDYLDAIKDKKLIYLTNRESLTFRNVKNNLKILDWLGEQSSPPFILYEDNIMDCILDDDLNALKWLFSKNLPSYWWSDDVIHTCMDNFRIEILKWFCSIVSFSQYIKHFENNNTFYFSTIDCSHEITLIYS